MVLPPVSVFAILLAVFFSGLFLGLLSGLFLGLLSVSLH
jgi:thiamine transporter ThiT